MSSYRASCPQNSPMPPLKQAECHLMQVWCACTQRSPRQDKRRQQNCPSLAWRTLWKSFIAINSPTTEQLWWAALEETRKERSTDVNLEGGVISPPQVWPSLQVTLKDWRRTCCPPTDSFFLNMATTVSPYSWLLWIWNTENAPDMIKTLLSAWQQRQYSKWEGWSSGPYKSQAQLAQNAKSNNISMALLRPEGSIETFRYNSESCCYFCKIQPEILPILKRFLWTTGFVKFSTSLFFPRISNQSAKSC